MMTQYLNSHFRWVLFAFLSLFLVACKPTAEFTYTPTTPSTGELVIFDASASSVYKAKEGNAIATYAWNFGDGSTAAGEIVEHTYVNAGDFDVTLTITDLLGKTAKVSKTITVQEATVINVPVSISVQSSNGALLSDATVTVHGQTTTTDENGTATLDLAIPNDLTQVVAKFEKDGFVTQSILVNTQNLSNVGARLLAIKQEVSVSNIEQAQTIQAHELNASIAIAENAFVTPDGAVATGAVTVQFTPWDIQSDDLNAMPANGVARDTEGNIVNLISAGMITATFIDENGQELQLASGQTADIQMDLPLSSINNQTLTIGTEIPMWHFDEAEGLWVEEGVGYVVASNTSPTGLAVQATVSHFSTWNWDFKFENTGSVFVQCQANGVGIPCNVVANIVLGDSSTLTKSNALPAEGLTVINMPASAQITWQATDLTNTLIGETASGASGNVIIDLGSPTTDNLVTCMLSDGTTVGCQATLNNDLSFSIANNGSRIITGISDDDGILQWVGQSTIYLRDGNLYRATGSITSTSTGTVNIVLDNEEFVAATSNRTIPVVCVTSESSINSCSLYAYIYGYDFDGNYISTTISLDTKAIGEEFEIPIPATIDQISYISVNSQNSDTCAWWGWEGPLPTETQQIAIYSGSSNSCVAM